jgi:hypothetical protein
MRTRLSLVITVAAAIAGLASVGGGTASAQVPKACTWGGTPLAPTGDNEISGHGLTGTPSTEPLHFHATGPLGGQCEGTMEFDGIMDAGATCAYITFHAKVFGLPGVTDVAGTAVAGLGPARLYDRDGNVVGSENAQFVSDPDVVSECNSPGGLTQNPFSSVVVLF